MIRPPRCGARSARRTRTLRRRSRRATGRESRGSRGSRAAPWAAAATGALVLLAACAGASPAERDGATGTTGGPAPTSATATEAPAPTTGSPSVASPSTPSDPPATTSVGQAPAEAPGGGRPTAGARRHPVGVVERTVTDPTRGRTLRVRILYPARGEAATTTSGAEVPLTPDAPPSDGGPFPLVLWAHGYLLPADGYDRLLAATASHGYVVAAPDFPGTSARGGSGNRSDLVNQPADLSFVADQVVALGAGEPTAAGPRRPIPTIDHPDRIAVAGHSDGGLTTTAIAYNRTYRDPRVAAAASFTGGIGLFGGSYDAADPPPLLLVHGTDDRTNGLSASVGARSSLATPSWLVTVDGGDHIGPYMFGTGRPDLGDALAAFLDAALEGDPDGLDRLASVLADGPGLALVP